MAEARKGCQTPTQSVVLPYTVTKGNEAIGIYNSTGRTAQEWQELMMYDILAINDDGLWVHTKFGYSIPRRASIQATVGTSVAISDLQPGDLVFYGDSEGVGHVVIYIGNGKVVHASTPSKGIIISDLYYRTPMCAKRII